MKNEAANMSVVEMARRIKQICIERESCTGCIFDDNGICRTWSPLEWDIDDIGEDNGQT